MRGYAGMVKLVDTRGLSPLEAMLYIGSRPIIHTEVKTKYADWIKRAIDNLECSQEFSERNFALAKTKDKEIINNKISKAPL